MRIAWLADQPGYMGGAEFTQTELRAAAPDGVEVVDVPPTSLELVRDCEVACVFNCVQYPEETIRALGGKRVIKRWADVAPAGDDRLKRWLLDNAKGIFNSPLHVERFPHQPIGDYIIIPPPIDAKRFRPPRQARRRERVGNCSVAQWRSPNKGAQWVLEWAAENGPVDVFGEGAFPPQGPNIYPQGPASQVDLPSRLWTYERFIFLPWALEPFGRCVYEAYAAGCKIVTNGNVGATHFIQNDPEAVERVPEDFWGLVADG